VEGAAGYLADAGATSNLKAVILFDPTDNGNGVIGLQKLTGANSVPVMLIAAPPCACNTLGAQTSMVLNNAPNRFIGVTLNTGSHLDAEGVNADTLALQFCGPAPTPQNAAALQTITAAWINDVFTGSQSGIYGPQGSVVSIGGAPATVIGVGNQPIVQPGP
jgi:hypothetical protein